MSYSEKHNQTFLNHIILKKVRITKMVLKRTVISFEATTNPRPFRFMKRLIELVK